MAAFDVTTARRVVHTVVSASRVLPARLVKAAYVWSVHQARSPASIKPRATLALPRVMHRQTVTGARNVHLASILTRIIHDAYGRQMGINPTSSA